ncbi:MAG: phosphotransferase [Chloroflexi bacterium]|nr:phosphotransferase [Chloroflexota bacterium]
MANLSRQHDVRDVVAAHMPDYQIKSVAWLGQGQENIAYLVNDALIVRFSKESNPEQRAMRIHREASVLAIVADVSPLLVPRPLFSVPEQGCLAYLKMSGVPLAELPRQARLAHAPSLAAVLGEFLRALHALPVDRLADLVDIDDDRPAQWRAEAAELYARVGAHVPPMHRRAVAAFFDAAPPDDGYALVFSHNDLGIEHVLVDHGTSTITGIIDWSDAAITDPAYDFGLLYRDLGPLALDGALGRYRSDATDVEHLRQRAVFYARCTVFEDLAYGLKTHQRRYIDNSLAAFEWLFAA